MVRDGRYTDEARLQPVGLLRYYLPPDKAQLWKTSLLGYAYACKAIKLTISLKHFNLL